MEPLQRDVEALRRIPLFAGLPHGRLKLLAYAGEVGHFAPGEVIAQQGEPADAIHVIVEGEAEVWLANGDGHAVCLSTLGRHVLLGETSVLCRSRRAATVRAKSHVVALRVSANVFLDLVRQSPEISMRVMTMLAQRLEQGTALLRQRGRLDEAAGGPDAA